MSQPGQHAGVILAAGASSRFGSKKVLVQWENEPLLRFLCRRMLEANLDPVRVVLGAYLREPRECIADLPVEVLDNTHWQSGMTSSLQTALDHLPANCSGILMTLGDHPYLPFSLIQKLVNLAVGDDLIMPRFQNSPGHPVLWLSSSFSSIQQLAHWQKPRDAHTNLKIKYLEWSDSFILEDIDTVSDYTRLVQMNDLHQFNKE